MQIGEWAEKDNGDGAPGTEKSGAEECVHIREELLADIQAFTLFSDVFLSVALDDVETCQYVLRVLLQDTALELDWVKTQYTILKLASRDARLDVLAGGRDGALYGMEIQNRDVTDHPRRVRFYDAMIDSEFLQKGETFGSLPELHFIYIGYGDFMGITGASEKVERIWSKTKHAYEDGSHILFVNAQAEDGTETARLMRYFKTADPEDMSHGALSRRVHFLKREERGQEIMCEVSERIERRERNRFQKLISAMVRAGETALLPKLGEDRDFVLAMYEKYKL